MQASECVIIYLNKNMFCVALSTICNTLKRIYFCGLCLNFMLYK